MRFPKSIYVSVQNTGSGRKEDEFLSTSSDVAAHAEFDKIVTVARYQLVELGTVTAEPKFVPNRKVKP